MAGWRAEIYLQLGIAARRYAADSRCMLVMALRDASDANQWLRKATGEKQCAFRCGRANAESCCRMLVHLDMAQRGVLSKQKVSHLSDYTLRKNGIKSFCALIKPAIFRTNCGESYDISKLQQTHSCIAARDSGWSFSDQPPKILPTAVLRRYVEESARAQLWPIVDLVVSASRMSIPSVVCKGIVTEIPQWCAGCGHNGGPPLDDISLQGGLLFRTLNRQGLRVALYQRDEEDYQQAAKVLIAFTDPPKENRNNRRL